MSDISTTICNAPVAPTPDGGAACIARVVASVDLDAIAHNLGRVRALAPRSRVMAAVKADAYGHGAIPVARALAEAGVDALAVACLQEALVLRVAGIGLPIVLLEGVLSAEEARLAAAHRLQMVVHARWQLALLQALDIDAAPMLWLKLDTGMHRLGFPAAEAAALFAEVSAHPSWRFCGWMTHLACADQPEHPLTSLQLERFERALQGLPGPRSIANSAAIIDRPDAHAQWVRPGLMLYGASPFADRRASALGLKPAMNLDSRLIAVQSVAAGESIGYGALFTAPAAMRVGVVAAGYADGVHRVLPSGTPVLVAGQRAPMVGRISMDMLAVDLSALPQAGVGDPVRLWGEGLPAEEIAGYAGTVAYELFCGLTRRVHFRYRG